MSGKQKNLKGWKKFVLAVKYIVTKPFVKYIDCISPILNFVHAIVLKVHIIMDAHFGYPEYDKCEWFIISLWFPLFLWYIYKGFIFHTITFPFHALAFSLEFFLLDKNYFSWIIHCSLHLFLFLSYSLFFPKFIDGFLKNAFKCNYKNKFLNYTNEPNSFNSEPKSEMWSFSYLIPRQRILDFYIWILGVDIFLSLILKLGFTNWIPHGEFE